jgi:hypothetical protein
VKATFRALYILLRIKTGISLRLPRNKLCAVDFYMRYTNKINANGNQRYYSQIQLKITTHDKNLP